MSNTIIAQVKLASGEVGYYDDYSRLYLTISNPIGVIYSGMNLTQIKHSVKSGRLKLISGSLYGEATKPVKVETPVKTEPVKPVEEPKKEEPVVEEVKPVDEVKTAEEVVEPTPVVEEEVSVLPEVTEKATETETSEEEVKPKRTRKKAAKTEEE